MLELGIETRVVAVDLKAFVGIEDDFCMDMLESAYLSEEEKKSNHFVLDLKFTPISVNEDKTIKLEVTGNIVQYDDPRGDFICEGPMQ